MSVELLTILLVEDSPADVRLTREALRDSKIANVLHVARDGVEALDFLLRRNRHAEAPRPDIVILDLNLPKMGRRELRPRRQLLSHQTRRPGPIPESGAVHRGVLVRDRPAPEEWRSVDLE